MTIPPPQMRNMLIGGPGAWRRADFPELPDWRRPLSPETPRRARASAPENS